MKKSLPPITTMMLDALVGTLPRLPEQSRYAAVVRCVYQVYSQTHGTKAAWDVTGETPQQCAKRVKVKVIRIEDDTDTDTGNPNVINIKRTRTKRNIAKLT